MTRLRSLALVLALTLSLIPAAPSAHAQPANVTLTGCVVDQNGGELPGATVTLISDVPTNARRTTVTDTSGQMFAVPAGSYSLSVDMVSFFSLVRGDIVVRTTAARTVELAPLVMRVRPESLTFVVPVELPPRVAPANGTRVRFETTMGAIDIVVDSPRAPITSANFLKYVDGHFYDGGRFHRATRADNYTPVPPNRPLLECIQAGIDPARKDSFQPIPLERTSVTGLKHVTGVVSMARGNGADTATSDFFILLNDQPSLDFEGKRFDDGQGAAAFGVVAAGMDVVRKIQQQPVQAQALTPPIAIVRAYRVK